MSLPVADAVAAPSLRRLLSREVISRPVLTLGPAALLSPQGPLLDAWRGEPVTWPQRHGAVRWAEHGPWLQGCVEVDEAGHGGDLQAAARQAYAELFALLMQRRCPHLLRLWNYIADINRPAGDSAASERYRLFNVGRQQAFLDAGRGVFDGAPAACALGLADGPLRVFFLAGQRAPLAIENPRQVSAYRYPERYGPRSPTFSRAALADGGADGSLLLISGTASIVGHESLHRGDVRRQTEESLANIDAVRDAAGAGFLRQDFVHTVYLRDAADLGAVREVFERHVGRDSPAARSALYVRADICRAELLVEIEAHGWARPAESGA